MTRHVGHLLIALLVSTTFATPAPAHAEPGTFAFEAVAYEDCFGCGPTAGRFTGTFTGIVGGHAYIDAPIEGIYTALTVPSQCPLTGSATGSMSVSDMSRTDHWTFNWTRSYNYLALAVTSGATNGLFFTTYVPVDPPLLACGGPARFDMRAVGSGL